MFMATGWFTRTEAARPPPPLPGPRGRASAPFRRRSRPAALCLRLIADAATARNWPLAKNASPDRRPWLGRSRPRRGRPRHGPPAPHVAATTCGFIEAPHIDAARDLPPRTICLLFRHPRRSSPTTCPRPRRRGLQGITLPPVGMAPAVPALIAIASKPPSGRLDFFKCPNIHQPAPPPARGLRPAGGQLRQCRLIRAMSSSSAASFSRVSSITRLPACSTNFGFPNARTARRVLFGLAAFFPAGRSRRRRRSCRRPAGQNGAKRRDRDHPGPIAPSCGGFTAPAARSAGVRSQRGTPPPYRLRSRSGRTRARGHADLRPGRRMLSISGSPSSSGGRHRRRSGPARNPASRHGPASRRDPRSAPKALRSRRA